MYNSYNLSLSTNSLFTFRLLLPHKQLLWDGDIYFIPVAFSFISPAVDSDLHRNVWTSVFPFCLSESYFLQFISSTIRIFSANPFTVKGFWIN